MTGTVNNQHDAGYHAILEAKYELMEEGVADLHCRSDKYLAEEVWREQKA